MVANESDDEPRNNQDNYALRLSSSEEGHKSSMKMADQDDEDSTINDDNYALNDTPKEKNSNIQKEDKEYEAEKKLGDMADLFGTNQHHSYPDFYKDFSRRFVLQYPYKEVSSIIEDEEAESNFDNIAKGFLAKDVAESHLIPVKASPERVLAVAAKAALLEAAIPRHSLKEKFINKEILRSGNYWNDVWREDVNPDVLRTQKDKVIKSVAVKIMPGSKLYKLVSELKKTSPRLIYVINKE